WMPLPMLVFRLPRTNICSQTGRTAHAAAAEKRATGGRCPRREARPPVAKAVSWGRLRLAADGGLQRRAGRELRHGRGRDGCLLAGVARVHTLPRGALLPAELADAGEGDVAARLEGVRDRAEHRLDGVPGVSLGQTRAVGDLLDELTLRHDEWPPLVSGLRE